MDSSLLGLSEVVSKLNALEDLAVLRFGEDAMVVFLNRQWLEEAKWT